MTRLDGTILDEFNKPVENATITIPASGQFALSDDRGQFTIKTIAPGIETIYVIHRDFQKFETDLHLENDIIYTITLKHD